MNELTHQKTNSELSTKLTKCLTNSTPMELLAIEKKINLLDCIDSRNLICNLPKKEALKQVFVLVKRWCHLMDFAKTEDQMLVLSSDICEKMQSESIEDVVYFLKKIRMGSFGKIYKPNGIMQFVEIYLEEKAEKREHQYKAEKLAQEKAENRMSATDQQAIHHLDAILKKLGKKNTPEPAPQQASPPSVLNNKNLFIENLPQSCKALSPTELLHQMAYCSYSMPEAHAIYQAELEQRKKK